MIDKYQKHLGAYRVFGEGLTKKPKGLHILIVAKSLVLVKFDSMMVVRSEAVLTPKLLLKMWKLL